MQSVRKVEAGGWFDGIRSGAAVITDWSFAEGKIIFKISVAGGQWVLQKKCEYTRHAYIHTYTYVTNSMNQCPWEAIVFDILTFRGSCIVIYSYNKRQRDALFLKFSLIKYSTRFGQIYCHHQESQHCLWWWTVALASSSQHYLYDIYLLLCIQY
jgi:hypothetical protein